MTKDIIICDWKDIPSEVIKSVNELLEKHKLQFKNIETKNDSYEFELKKVK